MDTPSYEFVGWRPTITRANMGARGKVPRYDGCSLKDWQQKQDALPLDVARVLSTRIPRTEVERHNDMDDLWMVIDGVVYDVTKFQMFHPGGEKILRACGGKDATDLYMTYH